MAHKATAQYEHGTSRKAYGETTPEEVLTLDKIPNEISSLITRMLTVDCDAPYVPYESSPWPTTDYSYDYDNMAESRQGLVSLCLVSRRMVEITQPALYRNVFIRDAKTLVLLYRSFLENPYLGSRVRHLNLNISHRGSWVHVGGKDVYESNELDLSPILYWNVRLNQYELVHDLGAYLTAPFTGSRLAPHKTPIEILYTLQFRVLRCTRNLDSLILNVHPHSIHRSLTAAQRLTEGQRAHNMGRVHFEVVSGVLRSMWEDISPCLASLKKLCLMGKESPYVRVRSDFVSLIYRSFLTLPKLEQLIWFNHAAGWFDGMPNRVVSGADVYLPANIEWQHANMRVLELDQSSCFPRDLVALCSTFPNLESLSVNTDSWHCRSILETDSRPPLLSGVQDPNSGMGAHNLADSLARLENLHTLNLDLHYAYNISQSLGSFGILGLASLPNLQYLSVPFHFFVRKDHDGYHKVVSPALVLPRSLKRLSIVACFSCIQFWTCEALYGVSSTYRHRDAVLEFLEGLTNVHPAVFPSLSEVYYHETESLRIGAYCLCMFDPSVRRFVVQGDNGWEVVGNRCPFHFHFHDEFDTSRLMAVSHTLHRNGVVFEKRAAHFDCPEY